MVRSENNPRSSTGAGAGDRGAEIAVEALGRLGVAIIRGGLLMLWWSILFPMLSVPAAGAGYLGWLCGWPTGVATAAAGALAVLGWRLGHPGSFHRLVSGRIWKRRRRWVTYRKPWPHVCALHGLNATLNDIVLIPKLRSVRVGYVADTVVVRMLVGQTLSMWQAQADALAHTFGARSVQVRGGKPGWIEITVHHSDPLAIPIPVPAPNETVDLLRLPVGVSESGHPWLLRILGRHLLVAGATGSGKGSVVWSTLSALAPGIRGGLVALWVIDPKGGMEFGAGQALFTRFAHDTGEQVLTLLRDATAIMTDRADRLRGVTRQHTPTPTEPLVLVVIDELASLTAYLTDRKIKTEVEQLLGLLLSQGRAVGVSVIACVQDPSKEVLALRQLFPTRVGLRLTEATQVNMVFGAGARERGALCDLIPDTLPGVGYVAEDGRTELIRVRAFHVADDDIAHLSTHYAPDPGADADRALGDAA